MVNILTVSRIYAKAAFQYSLENHTLLEWKKMLSFFSKIINKKNINIFFSSSFSNKKKIKILKIILKKYNNQYYENFIKILVKKKRIQLIPKIFLHFKKFLNEYNKVINIKIISATYLSKNQINLLKLKMEKKLLHNINFIFTINTKLISGLIFELEDSIIDYSIRNRLTELKKYLKNSREYII